MDTASRTRVYGRVRRCLEGQGTVAINLAAPSRQGPIRVSQSSRSLQRPGDPLTVTPLDLRRSDDYNRSYIAFVHAVSRCRLGSTAGLLDGRLARLASSGGSWILCPFNCRVNGAGEELT
ncbi:hypothetical protein ISCGN_012408 [Ixodes scapularis]